MKVRCDIKGLHCPHCAVELEKRFSEIEGVSAVNINFSIERLVLEVNDDMDEDDVVELAQNIADNFEEGITISICD